MSQLPFLNPIRVAGSTAPRGRFICFEGVDGAGKTTLGARVAEAIEAQGEAAIFLEKKSSDLVDPALADRMARLRTLIWDYGEAPIAALGDDHSLYIVAAWFAAFDRAMIAPRLANGVSVVVDNWVHKFVARFAQKPGIDLEHVRRCFGGLTPLDHVVFLDIDPSLAASRKSRFTQGEVGNLDGVAGRSAEDFVRYQRAVRESLRTAASLSPHWLTLSPGTASADALAGTIVDRLGPWPPAASSRRSA